MNPYVNDLAGFGAGFTGFWPIAPPAPVVVPDGGAGSGGRKKKKKRELPPTDQPYRVVPYPYPEAAEPEEAGPELPLDASVSGVLLPRISLADALPVIEALKSPPVQATTTLYSDEAYRKRQQQLKEDDELILAFIRMIS